MAISYARSLAYSWVGGNLFACSLVGVLLLSLLLLLLPEGFFPMVDPTLSSNDLKADEFLTSTNFLPILSPREPKISVVFSAANLTVSLVFWYLFRLDKKLLAYVLRKHMVW